MLQAVSFGPFPKISKVHLHVSDLPMLMKNLGEWQSQTLSFEAVAWRVSWSLTGNVLAVSTGDNKVTLWKERLSGGWENVQTIEE